MKTLYRALAVAALFITLLTHIATAQTQSLGAVTDAATLGSGTAASVYFNFDANLDGQPDFTASMFHPSWCLLKDCLLDKESAVIMAFPNTFAGAGTGKVSGNTLAGKKRDAPVSVSVYVTDSGGRYKRGTTWFLIKDDLGLVTLIDLTYNNVFCTIKRSLEEDPTK